MLPGGSARGRRRAPGRRIAAIGIGACALLLLLGSTRDVVRGSDAPTKPGRVPEELPLSERAKGSPACERLLAEAPPGAFEADPHRFRCSECHDSRTGEFMKPALKTCASLDCHVRAWNETPLHNIDPAVFADCRNCHAPHDWRPAGRLCASCHAEIRGPEGEIAVTGVAGVASFSHARHEELGCGACHASEGTHGALALRSAADCRSCHHGREQTRSCAACHAGPSFPSPLAVALPMRLSAAASPRPRSLPFEHARHETIACSRCHATPDAPVGSASCRECHAGHGVPVASCAPCHGSPPPGVHTLAVHEGGCKASGCHGSDSFDRVELARPLCVSCHVDRTDHMPGRDCATCHLVERQHGGGAE